LYFASSEGHKEIVELLIANGAHVNPRADIGDTPLDGAIEDNHTEIADILRKHGGKSGVEHSIRVAAGATGRKGNIEAVKQYLAAGTDVDARDAEDKTPLQHADVNAKDDGGLTPLHFAAREGGHKEIDYKDICINLAIDPDEEIVLDEPAEDLTCLSVFDLLNGRLMELA
jgi:cytohesin